MKILHILSQMPNFTGSEKYIQVIINHAAQNEHKNFLVGGAQGNFSLAASFIGDDHTRFVRFDCEDLNFPIPGMSDVMPYESTVFSTMRPDQIKKYKTAFKKVILNAVLYFSTGYNSHLSPLACFKSRQNHSSRYSHGNDLPWDLPGSLSCVPDWGGI
jgi:hypothetical protein